MKLVKYFDIHDLDVPPVVYILFFALIECKGNDIVYEELVESWYPDGILSENTYAEESYRKYIGRGYRNCYHNEERMKEFCQNPPSLEVAVGQCWEWLEKQGLSKDDEFFLVKIWW